jgi:hypothetical protein
MRSLRMHLPDPIEKLRGRYKGVALTPLRRHLLTVGRPFGLRQRSRAIPVLVWALEVTRYLGIVKRARVWCQVL